MQTSQENYQEYLNMRNNAVNFLKEQPLKNNANVTYGDILAPQELELLADLDSSLAPIVGQIYSEDELNQINKTAQNIINQRVVKYNRAPIDFDVAERFPEYTKELERYNEFISQDSETRERIKRFEEGVGIPSEITAPLRPIGLENAQKIAARGFEPDNEVIFPSWNEAAKARTKTGFAPRIMTKEDWQYIGNQHGLEGDDYIYIDPSNPSLGTAYKAPGEGDYKLLNTPYITAEDTYKFLVNEVPAIAGDIGLLVYGGKKFGAGTGLYGNLPTRAGKVLGLSGLSAAGAAGGDFLRLTAGYMMNAHDREFMDIFKESGLIGALSFGGTAVISTASHVIPGIWQTATGKKVPAEFFERIEKLMQKAKASERGENIYPGAIGTEQTMKQINEAIDDLATRFKVDMSKYNPTLSSRTGSPAAADLEALFLKYADDEELRNLYTLMKQGNQEVIDSFIQVLSRKFYPEIGKNVTAEQVGGGLRAKLNQEITRLNDESYKMFDSIRNNLLEAEDIALPGQSLLKKVPDEKASTPLFERTQKRLKEIKDDYTKGFRKEFENVLKQDKYVDLTTGAGFTKKPTNEWMKVRKGESSSLFKAIEADEAADILFGSVNKAKLNRLRGMNPRTGKFANGDEIAFTLDELNATREALNSFASQTDNLVAREYARELERGLEKQMYKLVQEGAALESGLALGSADLKIWMKENKWGDDIVTSWKNHAQAIEDANSEAIKSIIAGRPEKVADYLLNTSVPNSRVNTPVTNLMKILKKEGSDEVLDVQRGMSEYVRQSVLADDGRTPFQIAKEYRQFMKENRGTLEAIFGKEGFKQSFKYSPKTFQKEVIDRIGERDAKITLLQKTYGLDDLSASKNLTNIVENVLKAEKDSGIALDRMRDIMKIVGDDPLLRSQISAVTKNFISKKLLETKQGAGGLFNIDGNALDNFIYREFGAEDIVGKDLTFDEFMLPLLGGNKQAKDYIKNLKILNEIVQREIGPPVTPGVARQLEVGEYGAGSPIEGARMAQRLLIAPLTQLGRRVTALSNRTNVNARNFIGEMLLDPNLFNKTMLWAQGKTSTQQFIRFLTSYGSVVGDDLANEIEFYDVEDKVMRKPEDMKNSTQQELGNILQDAEEFYDSIMGAQ
jgi:hypothetical protein